MGMIRNEFIMTSWSLIMSEEESLAVWTQLRSVVHTTTQHTRELTKPVFLVWSWFNSCCRCRRCWRLWLVEGCRGRRAKSLLLLLIKGSYPEWEA